MSRPAQYATHEERLAARRLQVKAAQARHYARRRAEALTPFQKVAGAQAYTAEEAALADRLKAAVREAETLAETLREKLLARLDREGPAHQAEHIRDTFTTIQLPGH